MAGWVVAFRRRVRPRGHERDRLVGEARPRRARPRWLVARFERGTKEYSQVLEALLELFLGQWVASEQALDERHVAEVAQDGAIAREEELLRIEPPKDPG